MTTLRPEYGLDPKSRLQHWAQGKFRITPVYMQVGEQPPSDDPLWSARVELRFADRRVEVLGQGEGRSLKRAQCTAALQALGRIELDEG